MQLPCPGFDRDGGANVLRRTEDLYGFVLRGIDGSIGRIHDLYFDEETWTVRYLTLDTQSWPIPRFVLLAPCVIKKLAWDKRRGSVQVTREQVAICPDVKPRPWLSWQHCAEVDEHFGWPLWTPIEAATQGKEHEGYGAGRVADRPLLQSSREMPAYRIEIEGVEIGRVADVLFDDETWIVRYLLVDCWHWSPGRRQLIPPECVKAIGHSEFKILAEFRHRLAPTG
jgi:sporulation protein YlmC with PRC-barrel domain